MSDLKPCPFCKSDTIPHPKGGVSSCSNVNCFIYGVWIPVYAWPEDLEYAKEFYKENRIRILQYDNLRQHFGEMVKNVLGNGYCNTACDVYGSDAECCKDITRKANETWLQKLIK